MQFRAIEPRLAGARDRVAKFLDDLVDVGQRQHVDRLPPPGFCDLHEMNDLRNDLRVRRIMDAPDKIGQSGHELIVADAQQRAGLGMVNGHRLDHDQAGDHPGRNGHSDPRCPG